MLFLQEIQDLNELISEMGGELGKIADEEKWQALNDIKELEVCVHKQSTLNFFNSILLILILSCYLG